MILKEGTNVNLQVSDGLYFPKEMGEGVKAYQLVNRKTGVVEFEEVQLAAVWEAFQHFEAVLGEIYDEMDGKTKPSIEIASAADLPEAKPH